MQVHRDKPASHHPQLKVLELAAFELTSLEQLSRLDTPILEELMLGRNKTIQESTK